MTIEDTITVTPLTPAIGAEVAVAVKEKSSFVG